MAKIPNPRLQKPLLKVFSTVCLSHKVKSENVVRWFGLFVKKKKKKEKKYTS